MIMIRICYSIKLLQNRSMSFTKSLQKKACFSTPETITTLIKTLNFPTPNHFSMSLISNKSSDKPANPAKRNSSKNIKELQHKVLLISRSNFLATLFKKIAVIKLKHTKNSHLPVIYSKKVIIPFLQVIS
jgi:hypothetical protein